MSHLTSVMYHYVRSLPDARFPNLKGLSLDQFDAQLDYICHHYSIVSMEQVIDSFEGREELPPMAMLLSFDDGYTDHFVNVFTRLHDRGISGAFYPPRMAVMDRQVLNVNKIQFSLASGADPSNIADTIREACKNSGSLYRPGEINSYTYTHPFDSKEVSYVKVMLGGEVPEDIREDVIDFVFRRYVTEDAAAFAEELYLSEAQLSEMVSAGMHVGSHSDVHHWMDHMSPQNQEKDIERSIELLERVGMSAAYRSYCYPFGRYNEATLEALRKFNFKTGLTCIVDLTDVAQVDPLLLPRLDTNHLPQQVNAAACEWTRKAAR